MCIQVPCIWRYEIVTTSLFLFFKSFSLFDFSGTSQTCKHLIYLFQIELLEMEKTQLGFQCEELKTEVAQLKASIPQLATNENNVVAEDTVNFSHGERYTFPYY